MSSIDNTDKLSLLFINRKDKTYIKSVVSKVNGEIHYQIYKSNDGIHDELTSEGIFAEEAMPKPESEIFAASGNLAKYIKKNGYKVCNTIIQTKNGIKFR